MTRPRHEILARIRACLKYADPNHNSNEHERAAAKAMAQKMIDEYGVTAKEMGAINSEMTVTFELSASENLSAVFEALKKSGVKPSRGWREDESQ